MRNPLLTCVVAVTALLSCLLLSSCGGGGEADLQPAALPAGAVATKAAPTDLAVGAVPMACSVLKGAKGHFQTDLQQGPRYVVTLQPLAVDEDSDLQVFQPQTSGGALIAASRRGHAASTVTNADWVAFACQQAGTYPIQVLPYSATTPGDPNDFQIEVDEAIQGAAGYQHTSGVGKGASKWYWFATVPGATYTVTLTPATGNADLYVFGAASDKLRGSSARATGVDTVTFTANVKAAHHLRVYGKKASTYKLQIAGPQPAAGNLFFLHHSTGQGLIDGGVRPTVAAYNTSHATSFVFWDHGYNGDGLHNASGDWTGVCYNIPNDNTDPDGLHYLWTSKNADARSARNQILSNHRVIAFKSCFPASAIYDTNRLNEYKTWYLAMRDFFDTRPDRLFVVMSTPPLHRLATNTTEANNARAFANWLKSPTYLSGHANLVCFDLFDKLARASDGSGLANRLRYEYEDSHGSDNSHPNALANNTVGPQFAQFLCEQAAAYSAP